jgi:hypothetical protein
MLMLLCVQVVQTNNNELSSREKNKQLPNVDRQNVCELVKKTENFDLKNLVDRIHKLIIKKLKLNTNCYIKIGRNHNLLHQSNNEF